MLKPDEETKLEMCLLCRGDRSYLFSHQHLAGHDACRQQVRSCTRCTRWRI